MVKRESNSLFVWVLSALCFFCVVSAHAQDETPSDSTEQTETLSDSTEQTEVSLDSAEESSAEESSAEQASEKSFWTWPLEYIIQPFLNGLIYPVAKPMDYAIKNGIIEKSVELISFGEDYKIMVYPSFNFKPGSRTMVGANYRHRSAFLSKDYLVVQGEYYANGDVSLTAAIQSMLCLERACLVDSATILTWTAISVLPFLKQRAVICSLTQVTSLRGAWELL